MRDAPDNGATTRQGYYSQVGPYLCALSNIQPH